MQPINVPRKQDFGAAPWEHKGSIQKIRLEKENPRKPIVRIPAMKVEIEEKYSEDDGRVERLSTPVFSEMAADYYGRVDALVSPNLNSGEFTAGSPDMTPFTPRDKNPAHGLSYDESERLAMADQLTTPQVRDIVSDKASSENGATSEVQGLLTPFVSQNASSQNEVRRLLTQITETESSSASSSDSAENVEGTSQAGVCCCCTRCVAFLLKELGAVICYLFRRYVKSGDESTGANDSASEATTNNNDIEDTGAIEEVEANTE